MIDERHDADVIQVDFKIGSREGDYDFAPEMPVHDVLVRLAQIALPPGLATAADEVCRRAAKHPAIAPFLQQRWGDLDETDGNLLAAAAVGLVAGDVFLAANAREAANEET